MTSNRATSDVIACSLTPADLKETQGAWKKLFRLSLISRAEVPGGVQLEFHPGSSETLRQLVDIERECCPWITFELSGPVVKLTATGNGESVVREIWA